jgi:8-hydroxy-5-deazaflavin:NADPH oxidoreductase
MSRYGVLGSGEVGRTLAAGLREVGHEVRIGTRDPAKHPGTSAFAEVARWAEALVLAVPGTAAEATLRAAGGAESVRGKLVIDPTNPIGNEPPEDGVLRATTGPNSSLMEQLQAAFPQAKFVKAFNSVGSDLMVHPKLPGGPPTMFICGNDADAKATVSTLLEQFGWEVADMGTAKSARAIEPLAQLWCIPGFLHDQWTHAFRLLRS